MKTIMKKVLSVIMVLAILLVPMTVMAAPGDSADEPIELAVSSGFPVMPTEVIVAANTTAWLHVADANGTLTVTQANGNYTLANGLLNQATPETETGNYTATLALTGYDVVTINNPSETDAVTLYLILEAGVAADTTGTMDNPEEVTLTAPMWNPNALGAQLSAELEEENQGRYYKVTAPGDGVIAISAGAYSTADYSAIGYQFNATNTNTSYQSEFVCMAADAEDYYNYVEFIPVSEGDEVVIMAGTYNPADQWVAPAGGLNVSVSFYANGSYENPEIITEAGEKAATVEAGSQGWYYEWVATSIGTVTVTVDDESGWQYNIGKTPVDENNWGGYYTSETHWYSDETVVTTESVDVEVGDTVKVWVNTYDPANEWTAPAGTINWTFDFEPVAANFAIDDTTAYVGKEFDVVVKINDNPGIISAKLDIGYDADVLELVGVKEGDLTATTESAGEEVSCYNYSEDYTANPYAVNWIDALSEENNTTNGTFVTLTFKVKDEAAAGDTQITIDYNPNNVFDKDLNNVEFNVVNATVTVKNHLPGDVNSDGVVNNRDYALLMQYLNKWEVTINEAAADVTGDGVVNNRDYALLMQYLNKWDVVLK